MVVIHTPPVAWRNRSPKICLGCPVLNVVVNGEVQKQSHIPTITEDQRMLRIF